MGDFLFIAVCCTFKLFGAHTIYGMEKRRQGFITLPSEEVGVLLLYYMGLIILF